MQRNYEAQNYLRLALYSGMTLIVVSMLFLLRDQQAFFTQAALILATPIFFYGIGVLVYRYLEAPLAAPGIVATGAWLIAVGLIHLWNQRMLLPDWIRPYYWTIASLLAVTIITYTGRYVRIWLLIPLVLVTQINAFWATLSISTLNIEWWAAISFILVLFWWEYPFKDDEWAAVYKIGAVLLFMFLLIFSYWLPAPTAKTMVTTWGAGALLVAVLSFRHGWINLGPLSIAMLACSVAWGFPPAWWSPLWLLIGIGTIIFIERIAKSDHNQVAVDLSVGLALILVGFSALLAVLLPILAIDIHPLTVILVLIFSSVLMLWMGWRGSLSIAVHVGLWLFASGWSQFYFSAYGSHDEFGLWLALLAVMALLFERILTSMRKQKRKLMYSLTETVARWPLADLIMGLTGMIVIWSALNITVVSPFILSVTLSIVVGVWLVAGLVYRLPLLLHIAVWIAPLPYALFILQVLPPFRSLPAIGLAWQLLGVAFLILGHLVPKYRPAMLAPFFIGGYALVGISMTLLMGSSVLLMVSLGIVVVVCFLTSLAVIFDEHPTWSAWVAYIVPPENHPYAYKHIHHTFLFLTSWLMAIWVQLFLQYVELPFSPGLVLVGFSAIWIVIGRILPRFPELIGWPLYIAGWFLWLIGLLQVFFSPTEAIVTAVLGILLSGELLNRSKEVYWMPVFILQVLFSVLQIAWLLEFPALIFVQSVILVLTISGMWYEGKAGHITAITGGTLAMFIWLLQPTLISTVGMLILALSGLLRYRHWLWVVAIYLGLGVELAITGLGANWEFMLIAGQLQWVLGALLVIQLRPRRYCTLLDLFLLARDWATPLFWFGGLSMAFGLMTAFSESQWIGLQLHLPILVITATWFAITLRQRNLPYLPVTLSGGIFAVLALQMIEQPLEAIGNDIMQLNLAMSIIAIASGAFVIFSVDHYRPHQNARWLVWWIRPAHKASVGFSAISLLSMTIIGSFYPTSKMLVATNCILLALHFGLVYLRSRRLEWLWLLLGISWLGWIISINPSNIVFYTLPLSIGMYIVADFVKKDRHAVEFYAALIMLSGGVLNIDLEAITPLSVMLLLAHILLLTTYGYLANKRLPFLMGITALCGGFIFSIIYINLWLLPLLIGVSLIGIVLLMEIQHDLMINWLSIWFRRLQSWR